jgi:hypothetical protein
MLTSLFVLNRWSGRGRSGRPDASASKWAEVPPGLLGRHRAVVFQAQGGPVDGGQSKQHCERRSKVGARAREARLIIVDDGPVESSGSRD